jgi:hypothetical protein
MNDIPGNGDDFDIIKLFGTYSIQVQVDLVHPELDMAISISVNDSRSTVKAMCRSENLTMLLRDAESLLSEGSSFVFA